ncbi:ABC transporter permease subunit [Spirochaeta cellobiosiphila]|uniref:ABC transporter permease subunit n=1 Tax=Spirochaeta cellobiosiphila TaxID=504483 RepID=UPI00040F9475|nr:ABC transporter permease [Spirochaeta cellobiosiphila]
MLKTILNILSPYLLAAIGGLFTELAGCLNIALEGYMVWGAFASVIIFHFTHSLVLSLSLALVSAAFIAYLQYIISYKGKADVFVVGLAFNLIIPGITALISSLVFSTKGVIRFEGVEGELSMLILVLQFLTILSLPLAHYFLYYTVPGLRLRGAGINEQLLQSRKVKANVYIRGAMIISGVLSAGGGILLALRQSAYVPGMVSGRGWIALVVIYLGYKNPLGVFLGGVVFASTELLSHFLQGQVKVSPGLLLALPYLLTVVMMVFFAILQSKSKSKDQH